MTLPVDTFGSNGYRIRVRERAQVLELAQPSSLQLGMSMAFGAIPLLVLHAEHIPFAGAWMLVHGLAWLVVAAGVLGALHQRRLVLDPGTRTFTYRYGFWPATRTVRGLFGGIAAVRVRRDYARRAVAPFMGRAALPWDIHIVFGGEHGEFPLWRAHDLAQARHVAETLRAELGCELVVEEDCLA